MDNQLPTQNITPPASNLGSDAPKQDVKTYSKDEAEALLTISKQQNKKPKKSSIYIIALVTFALCISIVILLVTGGKS